MEVFVTVAERERTVGGRKWEGRALLKVLSRVVGGGGGGGGGRVKRGYRKHT